MFVLAESRGLLQRVGVVSCTPTFLEQPPQRVDLTSKPTILRSTP